MENLVMFAFDTIDSEWYFSNYFSNSTEAEEQRKNLMSRLGSPENYDVEECVVIEKCPPFMDIHMYVDEWLDYKNSRKEFPTKKLVDFKTSSYVEKENYYFEFGRGGLGNASFVAIRNDNKNASLKLEKWEVIEFHKYLGEYIKQRWGENA